MHFCTAQGEAPFEWWNCAFRGYSVHAAWVSEPGLQVIEFGKISKEGGTCEAIVLIDILADARCSECLIVCDGACLNQYQAAIELLLRLSDRDLRAPIAGAHARSTAV